MRQHREIEYPTLADARREAPAFVQAECRALGARLVELSYAGREGHAVAAYELDVPEDHQPAPVGSEDITTHGDD